MRKTSIRLTKTTLYDTPGKRKNFRRLWCVTWPKVEDGIEKGRRRKFFPLTKEGELAAKTFLEAKVIERQNYGSAGLAFNEQQRSEYLECAAQLKPFGATLRQAVAFYIPHLQATQRSCSAAELVGELLSVKTADGASVRYLSDLRSRLGQFAVTFDGKPVAEITSSEVDRWLRGLGDSITGKPLAAVTRNNFRRVLIVAFNFAKGRGYCTTNPAEASAKARGAESPVGILTLEETARLLERAPNELVPFIAIGAFAGLRRAEIERLDWSEVDLEAGLIEVAASKAKSARRRFIRIQPNLGAWLRPFAQRSGDVTPAAYRNRFDEAREAAGITTWPGNALRHSFASYYLAHFNDAAALALEMGHSNSNLVFQHYRQLVRPSQAELYWHIAPGTDSKEVVEFTSAIA